MLDHIISHVTNADIPLVNAPVDNKQSIDGMKKIDWGNDMKTKEEITNILTETLCYAYCDNCGNDMDEDLCGDCHRKYQNWKLSVDVAEKIADEILE